MTKASLSNFWDRAASDPAAVVLVDEQQREWTAQELEGEANRIANGLRQMGLRERAVIACIMPSSVQLIAVLLATNQVGMYLLTVNPRFKADEIEYLLTDSDAKVVIAREDVLAEEVISLISNRSRWVSVGLRGSSRMRPYEAVFPREASHRPLDRSGGAVLSYTSGTTGRPKGVLRPVANLAPEQVLAPLVRWYASAFAIDLSIPHVFLSCCPIYFAGPMMYLQYSLHLGHKVVLLPAWNPRVALSFIERFRVTDALMVPYHFRSLIGLGQDVRQKYDVSSLRCIVHGGAPCPVDVKREILDWFGDVVYETYGATEVGATVANSTEWRMYPGTVGRGSVPEGVVIFDAAGNRVKTGEVGRIFLRQTAADAFVYKDDERKTTAARIGDHVTVGDVGYVNEDGYLFICDRSADLILCRGENVYPAQVESVLAVVDGVLDCGCYGIAHTEWGEEVVIAIRAATGVDWKELLRVIETRLQERLSGPRVPTTIRFVEEIPRDEAGKLKRHQLYQQRESWNSRTSERAANGGPRGSEPAWALLFDGDGSEAEASSAVNMGSTVAVGDVDELERMLLTRC